MASDKLDELRAAALVAREMELERSELEQRLKLLGSRIKEMYTELIPNLMDEARVDKIGVPRDGNKPALDFVLKPYFSANIAASWPEEKRAQGFNFLKTVNAGDLIKTEVTVRLPRGNEHMAKLIVDTVSSMDIPGVSTTMKQNVHPGTLSSWLREVYDRGQTLAQSDLEKIGGSVGRQVKPQERTD